jgi:hypothetical protein
MKLEYYFIRPLVGLEDDCQLVDYEDDPDTARQMAKEIADEIGGEVIWGIWAATTTLTPPPLVGTYPTFESAMQMVDLLLEPLADARETFGELVQQGFSQHTAYAQLDDIINQSSNWERL